MECRLSFSLADAGGAELASGKAKALLGEESVSVSPEQGSPLLVSYRDVSEIRAADFRIDITLSSGELLGLSHLGRYYEGFARELNRLYDEQVVRDLLMNERLREPGFNARFSATSADGSVEHDGSCELRLYETAVVIVPESGEPSRIPLSDVGEVVKEEYSLVLGLEDGSRIAFSAMGKKLDHAVRSVRDASAELSLKVQSMLKELVPTADAPTIWRASEMMKEGRAAARGELEAVSPELWDTLEKKLGEAGIGEEYELLKRLSRPEKLCIGIKRGLMGDLTGEYVWFLVPIYGEDREAPGNALAMEAGSEGGTGKATYFFRILGRDEYREAGPVEALDLRADELLRTVNRCMQAINFRREPVYLPDERLLEPRYARYAAAVRRIPELRRLRGLFIGRVVHASFEQWSRDVADLLEFNVRERGDGARWRAAGGEPEA